MNPTDFNNLFGDMDLFLLDALLKGHLPTKGRVLDIGCGEGRNAIYFLQKGFEYHGWDIDRSKIKLLEYFVSKSKDVNSSLTVTDFKQERVLEKFDLIVCSRVLHFADSTSDFLIQWKRIRSFLKKDGILYVSMDSAVDHVLAKKLGNGLFLFPDGKARYALTTEDYEQMKKGFEEVEPLKTLIHHNARAQSFVLLRKC